LRRGISFVKKRDGWRNVSGRGGGRGLKKVFACQADERDNNFAARRRVGKERCHVGREGLNWGSHRPARGGNVWTKGDPRKPSAGILFRKYMGVFSANVQGWRVGGDSKIKGGRLEKGTGGGDNAVYVNEVQPRRKDSLQRHERMGSLTGKGGHGCWPISGRAWPGEEKRLLGRL